MPSLPLLQTRLQERSELMPPSTSSQGFPSSVMPTAGCGPPPNPASLLAGAPCLKGLQAKQQPTLTKGGTHHPLHNSLYNHQHHHWHNKQQTHNKLQCDGHRNTTNNESAVDSRARKAGDAAAFHGLGSMSGSSLYGPDELAHHHVVPYRVERAPSQRRYGHLYEMEKMPGSLGGHHADLGDEPLVPVRVLVCCLCGVLMAVFLLYLLYEYVRQQTEMNSPLVDADNLEFFNAVYSHRVAQIIRTAAAEAPPPRAPPPGWAQGGGVATPYLAHVLESGAKLLGPGGTWDVDGGGSRRGLAAELVKGSADAVSSWSGRNQSSGLHDKQTRKMCHFIPPFLGEYYYYWCQCHLPCAV